MFKLLDLVNFTFERIRQHLILVLLVLVGLSVATTLALSLPLYVDSVYTNILASRLGDPPYAFLFRGFNITLSQADLVTGQEAIEKQFVETIQLPTAQSVRYERAGVWAMRVVLDGKPKALGNTFGVAVFNGAESQMIITQGTWPPTSPTAEGDPVPVLIAERLLYTLGLQVGDTLQGQARGGKPKEFIVAAMWRENNDKAPLWQEFPPKNFFADKAAPVLIVQEVDLWPLVSTIDKPITEVAWYLNFDGRSLRTSQINALLGRIQSGIDSVKSILPPVDAKKTPEAGLRSFKTEVDALMQQLFIIILPVGFLVMYFVSLVAGLLVTRQQKEDVKLRSRGMSRRYVMSVHTLMWLTMVGIACGIGLSVAPQLVFLIGRTASFLDFSGQSSVRGVYISTDAIQIGLITGLIAASSGLWLAFRTTRQNVRSFRRQSGSAVSLPLWGFMTFVTLGPALYVLYTLTQKNGLQATADTPFSDPLTFVGPTLFIFGLVLSFLLILPLILSIGARLIAVTTNVPLLMTLRELTRNTSRYRGTLLMMGFTLSLTGFTASMASTLDKSLLDTLDYRIGAPLSLVLAADAQTSSSASSSGAAQLTVTGYNAPPVQELASVPGVAYYSRIGRYDVRVMLKGKQVTGTIVGVDRLGLAAVTRYRSDFSDVPLANLMNDLAQNRTGVILNEQTATQYKIRVGDEIEYQVNALGEWQNKVKARVVGTVRYFPTLDPSKGVFLIGNIDPIFEISGTPLPSDVWLSLKDGANRDDVLKAIRAIQFPVLRWFAPEAALQEAQAQPARRGVFGFLSVGFIASIALTLIAAVIQSTSSFQAQADLLRSLRAMGLGRGAVMRYVVWLQGLVAGSGIASGTLIGILTTQLYLPLLDFSGGLPPYQVRVAWDQIFRMYAVLALAMVSVTVVVSLVLLMRERLSTAMKVGE